jgi:hypothetical protein
MAGRTPKEAVQNFLDPLRQALSCVTHEVLYIRSGTDPSSAPYALMLNNSAVSLRRDRHFTLEVIQHYRLIETEAQRGPWKVQTVAYYYTLSETGDNLREILGYHWHPQGRSWVTYPHLHLYGGAEVGRDDVRKAHFPTGRMALEEVLQLAIKEFGVAPLRDDWEEILNRTQGTFKQWRTWP